MPKFDVTAPDGRVYEVNAPTGATQDDAIRYVQQNLYKQTGPEPVAPPPKEGGILQGAGNLIAGAVRGAGSIGATILAPVDMAKDALAGKGLTLESNRARRAAMDGALQDMGADTDSWMYQGGKLAGEVAGTAGTGGVLGNVLARAGASAPVVSAVTSSGFNVAGKTGKAAAALRAAGGALTGGASAALVDPESAGTGAIVGGVLPGAVQVIGKAGAAAGEAVRKAKLPKSVKTAQDLAKALDMTPQQLAQAIDQPGPQLIPGYRPTVPQILQKDTASQLQRTLKTAGGNALGNAERVQQEQFMQALNRVAPVDVTVQDAANRAGGAIQSFAMPERQRITEAVAREFDSVDPFNESALMLPIDEMKSAAAKYLGPGTFGTGGRASEAISTAQRVGMMELPAIAPIKGKAAKPQTLEQAVRAAGGIKSAAGEVLDLGRKQSGTTGLLNNKSGRSADLLADTMYQRGFIPDNDPATLIEALRNGGGRNVFASDIVDDAFASRMAASMGDAPGAELIPKAVPFQTVQNLRSSIGEAAEAASAKGSNKEAAALRQMVAEIDSRVNRAAGGAADVDEFFPQSMADQYRKALALHAEKMKRFETGPQAGMFRKAGDGQAQVQGAEIPGKFFSGRRSQVEDMQALKRLVGDRPALMDEMKRYAVTEGASTTNATGDLTSKYIKWLESRSGAAGELFNKQELATLKEVGKAVQRSIDAENLGRVTGSDTAQKLASLNSLGLLDNKVVSTLANRVPIIGNFSGPALDALRNSAAQTRNNTLAGLLSNPDDLAAALRLGQYGGGPSGLLEFINRAGAASAKVAPVISAQ